MPCATYADPGVAIADVLELDVPPTELLSARSINERMKRSGRLWDWAAKKESYRGSNPFYPYFCQLFLHLS